MKELNRSYLNELKNENRVVGRLIEEIKGFIPTNDVQGIVSRMDLLKNGLIAHIEKEDKKLYADLLKTAREKNIEMVSIIVSAFSTAMKGIVDRILKFFDKYPDKDVIARLAVEFSRDFQGVCEDIQKMVNNEEKVLYPMYEKNCC